MQIADSGAHVRRVASTVLWPEWSVSSELTWRDGSNQGCDPQAESISTRGTAERVVVVAVKGSNRVVCDPIRLYQLRDGVYAPDLLIVAVVDLDLFSWLERHPGATESRICAELGLAARPVDVMVTYLVALGLLDRLGDVVAPTELARQHFTAGSLFDLRAYYASLRERPACAELRAILTTGEPAAWASAAHGDDWASRLDDPAFAAGITAAMDARGRFLGPHLADALADVPMSNVLDIGGSSGIYLCALADARDGLRGAVFERPPIDRAARALLQDRSFHERIQVIAGDMFTDPLPEGFDLHLLSHVLHDWDEQRVRRLLSAAFTSLTPGGFLVDHDVHVNRDKSGPLAAAEYSVLLMHATHGKCWSVGELEWG